VLTQEVIADLVLDSGASARRVAATSPTTAQLERRPAADVTGVPVDLDGLHLLMRQEFGEGEVGAEHQQHVGVVDRAVAAAVAEQAVMPTPARWVVVLEPLPCPCKL